MNISLRTTMGALAILVTLTGCTNGSTADTAASTKPAAESPPTIDPGPVELTTEESAVRYLSIVCPNNIASRLLEEAFTAGESDYLNGGAPDVSGVVAAATVGVESHREAMVQLDETYFTWPELVTPQLAHVRSSYMAELAWLAAVAGATDYDTAYRSVYPAQTAEQQAAGQEIRYQLGLAADTNVSCAGYESGLVNLAAEKSERDAALAELK